MITYGEVEMAKNKATKNKEVEAVVTELTEVASQELLETTGDNVPEESTNAPEMASEVVETPTEEKEDETKEMVEEKVAETALVERYVSHYPVDVYGFTSKLRKAVKSAVSKARQHPARAAILKGTLEEALRTVNADEVFYANIARVAEENEATRKEAEKAIKEVEEKKALEVTRKELEKSIKDHKAKLANLGK